MVLIVPECQKKLKLFVVYNLFLLVSFTLKMVGFIHILSFLEKDLWQRGFLLFNFKKKGIIHCFDSSYPDIQVNTWAHKNKQEITYEKHLPSLETATRNLVLWNVSRDDSKPVKAKELKCQKLNWKPKFLTHMPQMHLSQPALDEAHVIPPPHAHRVSFAQESKCK
jgi:hypothetical protein